MNEATRHADSDLAARLVAVERENERLLAVNFVLTARVASLEDSLHDIAMRMGLDGPPRVIGDDWRTIKQTAFDLNLSQSGVRARIARGALAAEKRGGRVLIHAAK